MTELRVGVVGGTRLPGNVRTFLENIRRLLTDAGHDLNCDLLIREGCGEDVDGYTPVDPGLSETERAIGTLRTLTQAVTTYANEQEPDLLWQVTKFPLHGCATTIAGRRTGTPVLTRFAGDNFNEFRFSEGVSAVKAFALNNLFGRVPVHGSERVIVLGPHGRSEIKRRNDDIPVTEIPQPVDRDKFSPVPAERERELARELGFPDEERIFLTVGRLTERKGMRTLVETAEELYGRGEPFRWYVIGDGPMRPELAATHGVEPLGRVDFVAMPDYYRAADLVVHPSLIEGLPNVLLEAAACGTPTVARNVGDSATAASASFEDDAELADLLTGEHDTATLGERFNPDRLREAYADALVETAGEK
ncbi:glycosyltransferase family 4 protein [Halomicroarcula sp. F28]|uniref:glycosyltransferase family 4 protein n=1 Tax=Haloarcula salinisoli TaxID=2487746 RepID=UPI001C73ABD6|nr:glycosyltransferase family 4 protein [Halomicroarcula salinisoli]MBX0285480.1 glycosyltransferase family 4 protein [Halomicroarcula salinisoli]